MKVTFRLSEQARVRVLVERRKGGRRKGKKCVAPTRALRRAKACTRYVRITSKSPPLMAGRNSISITTRRWAAGAYRFTITATDNAGNVTKRVARNLTVAKKKPRKK